MRIQEDLTFYDLQDRVWGNAIQVLDEIATQDKEDDFMDYIEEIFAYDSNPPSMTELNDFISYEWEQIYEDLDIKEDEDDE